MSGGVLLKKHLPGATLKKIFGWAIIGTAAVMFVQT
jgi:uncharacterized membrane protein YfcA